MFGLPLTKRPITMGIARKLKKTAALKQSIAVTKHREGVQT
jgi:hypothetical protein